MKSEFSLIIFLLIIIPVKVLAVEEMSIRDIVEALSGDITPESSLLCSEDLSWPYRRYEIKEDYKEKFSGFYKLLNDYQAATPGKKEELLPEVQRIFRSISGKRCGIEVSKPLSDTDNIKDDVLMLNCPYGTKGESWTYFLFQESPYWSIEPTYFNHIDHYRNRAGPDKALMRFYNNHLKLNSDQSDSLSKLVFPHIELAQ